MSLSNVDESRGHPSSCRIWNHRGSVEFGDIKMDSYGLVLSSTALTEVPFKVDLRLSFLLKDELNTIVGKVEIGRYGHVSFDGGRISSEQ